MTLLQKEESDEFSQISLQIMAPIGSQVSIRNLQTLTLTDLFVYVTSCFGTWFGLSFVSLRPSRLMLMCRRRECHCDSCSRLASLARQEIRALHLRST